MPIQNDNPLVRSKLMSAEDAASLLPRTGTIATSGFTNGHPKAIPAALARRIASDGGEGEFGYNLYTGASTGEELDGVLARAKAIRYRTPFMSTLDLRNQINSGEVEFVDAHLSHLSSYIAHGILDPIDAAIVEAVDVASDGRIYLTTSSGMSPTFVAYAREVFVELNEAHPLELKGYHDIFLPELAPHGRPIHITSVDDRIGVPYVSCDPGRIRGIVKTHRRDHVEPFRKPDAVSAAIAGHVLEFVRHEVAFGRIPKNLLPFQSGVGNVANAVLAEMAAADWVPPVRMYTEVLQDSVFDLLDAEKLEFASTCALTFSPAAETRFHESISELRRRFVIRPQEISNNPEVIRRMGIIAMNTALEVDIYGHVNSTHVMGSAMMNGIGGSGDFTRNAYISIFLTPSTAKGGKISAVVPMVSHVDHVEHSVQIVVTERGLADLRGLCPVRRARAIIENCAAPQYRDLLEEYLDHAIRVSKGGHMPHDLDRVFELHRRYADTGSMLPE